MYWWKNVNTFLVKNVSERIEMYFATKKGVKYSRGWSHVSTRIFRMTPFSSLLQTRFRDEIHHYGLCQYDSRPQKVNQQHSCHENHSRGGATDIAGRQDVSRPRIRWSYAEKAAPAKVCDHRFRLTAFYGHTIFFFILFQGTRRNHSQTQFTDKGGKASLKNTRSFTGKYMSLFLWYCLDTLAVEFYTKTFYILHRISF